MNLLILTSEDQLSSSDYQVSDHRAEHILTVLKLAPGDGIDVGLLNGPTGRAEVVSIASDRVVIRVGEMVERSPARPEVDLICALPRPQTLKKVLLSAAMMGVRRLDLVRANRVERSYYQSPLIQPANYRPFLLEGLAQGCVTRLPEIAIHKRFRPFFEDVLPGRGNRGILLLPHPESSRSMAGSLRADPWPGAVTAAIGPEGGWVDFETDLMRELGFEPISLGRWILRVEHAVTAVMAQIELLRMNHERR